MIAAAFLYSLIDHSKSSQQHFTMAFTRCYSCYQGPSMLQRALSAYDACAKVALSKARTTSPQGLSV